MQSALSAEDQASSDFVLDLVSSMQSIPAIDRRHFLASLLAFGSLPFFDSIAEAEVAAASSGDDALVRWWPIQKRPASVIRTTPIEDLPVVHGEDGQQSQGTFGALSMLLQSLSGLAAQAVNEGRSDELIWIETNHPAYRRWYRETIERTGIVDQGQLDVWKLLARCQQRNLVKGYVLMRLDRSEGAEHQVRDKSDESVNVATALCGVLGAILVDESLEEQVRELGFEKLADARQISLAECFETYRDQFNRSLILAQDPRKPFMRELSIAHRCLVIHGQAKPVPQILSWLKPLSSVLGWNAGDEGAQVRQFSEYGHVLTVSDWAHGIPLLSVAYDEQKLPQVGGIDPAKIDWSWQGPCHAMVMSDGDNVQWALGDLTETSRREFWDDPTHGWLPFSWTTPTIPLAQAAPVVADYLARTRKRNVSLVEFGGGYIFPDCFGRRRDEADLLDQYAIRLAAWMKATDTRVLSLLVWDIDSEKAQRAYQTLARRMPDLVGMIAIEYSPYEGGEGRVFWVDNGQGSQLPVMTCRYALWAQSNRPNTGSPSEVAAMVRRDLTAATKPEDQLAWTIVHAWSWFRNADQPEEEEVRQQGAERRGARRGHVVAHWSQEKLGDEVRSVTIEELLWRLRMAKDPERTRQAIHSEE